MVGGLADIGGLRNAALVPGQSALAALVLQTGHQLLLAPPDLRGEVAQAAELAEVAQLDAAHGVGHELPLLGVVGGGDSLEDLEPAEGLGSTGGLVGDHAADGAPEDTGGGAVVDEGAAGVG